MRLRRHGNPETVNRPGPKAKAKAKPKNEALQIAKASNGELDSNQVRILRALRAAPKGKELTRRELIGSYSRKWLDSLWALRRKRPPLINIGNYEGDRKAYHSIRAEGKASLKKAEDAAATILECANKS